MLREEKEKLSAELVTAVEAKVTTLRSSKDKDDMAAIKADTEALSMELAKVHDEVAKATAGAQAAPGADAGTPQGGENPAGEGEVRDAEVK